MAAFCWCPLLATGTEASFKRAERILREIQKRIAEIDKKFGELKEILELVAELNREIISILRSMDTKLDLHTRILKSHDEQLREQRAILEEHTRILKSHDERLDRIEKDVRNIKVTIRRLTYGIEEEGVDVVPLFLEKVIGIYVPMRRLEIEHVIEIDLFGETDEFFVIGECMSRIGPSGILEVLEKAIKLPKHMPKIKTKKIVLVAYGIEYIEIAKDFAEQSGVSIITTRGIVTKPTPLSLEEIERNYEKLLSKLRKDK